MATKSPLGAVLASTLDFSQYPKLEQFFLKTYPNDCARNTTLSKSSVSELVRARHTLDAKAFEKLILQNELLPEDLAAVVKTEKRIGTRLALLRSQKLDPTTVLTLVRTKWEATVAGFVARNAEHFGINPVPNDVIDACTPATKLLVLARSRVGEYLDMAEKWVGQPQKDNRHQQQKEYSYGFLLVRRPDLLGAVRMAAETSLEARKALCLSGLEHDAHQQLIDLKLTALGDALTKRGAYSLEVVEYLANYRSLIRWSIQSPFIRRAAVAEILRVFSHDAAIKKLCNDALLRIEKRGEITCDPRDVNEYGRRDVSRWLNAFFGDGVEDILMSPLSQRLASQFDVFAENTEQSLGVTRGLDPKCIPATQERDWQNRDKRRQRHQMIKEFKRRSYKDPELKVHELTPGWNTWFALKVEETFGDNETMYQTMLHLSDSWDGTLVDLLQVAKNLC